MRDGINTPMVALVGVVSAVLLFALIVGVQVLYLNFLDADLEGKTGQSRFGENLIVEQENKLQQRGWLDRRSGIVALPIDRAMALTIEELKREQAENAESQDNET